MSTSDGQMRPDCLKVLVSEAAIKERVAALAQAITRDHGADRPLVIVAVMKGALVFLADLIRQLPMPVEIALVNARSYQGMSRRGSVEVLDDVAGLPLEGKHVLLLDCVLDSGHTLAALQRRMGAVGPASLKACVLFRKRTGKDAVVNPDYVGLDIPGGFVVGYGLDHCNDWRQLSYVAQLPPEREGDAQ